MHESDVRKYCDFERFIDVRAREEMHRGRMVMIVKQGPEGEDLRDPVIVLDQPALERIQMIRVSEVDSISWVTS